MAKERFVKFEMAKFADQWQHSSMINLHSSNPEPFSIGEIQQLIDFDLFELDSGDCLDYESLQGRESLRRLIASEVYCHQQADQIILTSGAQEGIFCCMHALLSKNDKVLTFTPGFQPLISVAEAIGCQVDTIELQHNNNWQIDLAEIERCLKQGYKVFNINFPHNPTGTNINQDELSRIITLCRKYDCWLFSDEVFRGLEHDPNNRLQPVADSYEKGISMGVMSKAFAMPGIRLGWLSTQNRTLVDKINQVKAHISICQSYFDVQFSLKLIPHHKKIYSRNMDIILANKSILIETLQHTNNLALSIPIASSTCFPILKNTIKADDFSTRLADQRKILVQPNLSFSSKQNGFRLALGQKHFPGKLTNLLKYLNED